MSSHFNYGNYTPIWRDNTRLSSSDSFEDKLFHQVLGEAFHDFSPPQSQKCHQKIQTNQRGHIYQKNNHKNAKKYNMNYVNQYWYYALFVIHLILAYFNYFFFVLAFGYFLELIITKKILCNLLQKKFEMEFNFFASLFYISLYIYFPSASISSLIFHFIVIQNQMKMQNSNSKKNKISWIVVILFFIFVFMCFKNLILFPTFILIKTHMENVGLPQEIKQTFYMAKSMISS